MSAKRALRAWVFGTLLLALGLAPASAQQVVKICLPITNSSSGIAVTSCYDISSSNPLPVTAGGGTQDSNLVKVGGVAVSLGQKTSAASIPMVLASDQSAVPTSSATDYAQGSTTSGQVGPLAQGAVTTNAPSYTTGTTRPLSMTATGGLRATISDLGGNSFALIGVADGTTNNNNAIVVANYGLMFNGATWDRGFTCTNTAQVNVTAGSTTQIVGLSGTTVIRVCGFAVSISLTGSAQFITGTGSNCGTPTTITPAVPLTTATPWSMVAPSGGSLFRGSAGGELCVAAVTGNVVGFVSYAQY